jgi:L-asparaginase
MQSEAARATTIVILGTGGTIAGTAADPRDNVGYSAAQLGVGALAAGIATSAEQCIETEQVAQIDSKDMGHAEWLALARRIDHHLARAEVCGIVVTHGTDTLEETAYFLQRVLAPGKPVVLTAAMRPATALQADGPQNLRDALCVACEPDACGVVAVLAGTVHGAFDMRKAHTYRLDAFTSGDAGPIAQVEEGRLRRHRDWPRGPSFGIDHLPADPAGWPRVAIVTSHAGAEASVVQALTADGIDGIAVAGTGNGRLHHTLEAALCTAQAAGVRVLRSTRCAGGAVVDGPTAVGADPKAALPSAGALGPAQARIELLLQAMRRD